MKLTKTKLKEMIREELLNEKYDVTYRAIEDAYMSGLAEYLGVNTGMIYKKFVRFSPPTAKSLDKLVKDTVLMLNKAQGIKGIK